MNIAYIQFSSEWLLITLVLSNDIKLPYNLMLIKHLKSSYMDGITDSVDMTQKGKYYFYVTKLCLILCDPMDWGECGNTILCIQNFKKIDLKLNIWTTIKLDHIFINMWLDIFKHKNKNNNLRYADDTTLVAESEEELKSLLMIVKEESEKLA